MRPLPPSLAERLADGGRSLTILVLRFGAMGDIVRTLPAVRLVRASLPAARLVWAVDAPWSVLLNDHPDIDRVVAVPRVRWSEQARRLVGLRDFDPALALDFHGNLRSGLTGLLSRASVRLGYGGHQQKEGNRFLTTHRVAAGPRRVSRIERNLELVRALGLPCDGIPDAGLVFEPEIERSADNIVANALGARPSYAVLSPGASRSQTYKRPPTSLLVDAVRALRSLGIPTVVVYGPGEESDARRVVDAEPRDAHLAPPTDLRILGALLRHARLFVGGDTGPMHLACGVGCPVVAIYGPTDPTVNGPWEVTHRAVSPPDTEYTGIKRQDRTRGRFEDIPPGAVEEAVRDVIALASS